MTKRQPAWPLLFVAFLLAGCGGDDSDLTAEDKARPFDRVSTTEIVVDLEDGTSLKLEGELTDILPNLFHATVLGWRGARRGVLHVRAIAERASAPDGVFQKIKRSGRIMLGVIGRVEADAPVWILAVQDELTLVRTADGTTGYVHASTLPLTAEVFEDDMSFDPLASGASGRLPGLD